MTNPDFPASRKRIKHIEDRLSSLAELAGFTPVLLDAIQPADVFIDLSGEDLRQRLCLIEQEGGERQCLRPDFTIPTGLNYVSLREKGAPALQKLSYAGPVYRRQEGGRPEEISQVGVESFGDDDREAADIEILSFTLDALANLGVKAPQLMMGDLELFGALLEAIDMPARWRKSLCAAIWRPAKFNRLLTRISRPPDPLEGRDAFFASIGKMPEAEAWAIVAGLIDYNGGMTEERLPGSRTVEEITARLMARAKDVSADPLPQTSADLIRTYLSLSGPPKKVLADILALSREAGLRMEPAIEKLAMRLQLLESRGLSLENAHFSSEFGRSLEYYTGFVFELKDHSGKTLAGGGRYDTLLAQLGLTEPLPAVGCAFKVANVAAQEETSS